MPPRDSGSASKSRPFACPGLSLIHMSPFLTTSDSSSPPPTTANCFARQHLERNRPEGRSVPDRGSRFFLQRSEQLPVPFAHWELPRPLVVFPAGGEAGKTQEFTFLGDAKGDSKPRLHSRQNPLTMSLPTITWKVTFHLQVLTESETVPSHPSARPSQTKAGTRQPQPTLSFPLLSTESFRKTATSITFVFMRRRGKDTTFEPWLGRLPLPSTLC